MPGGSRGGSLGLKMKGNPMCFVSTLTWLFVRAGVALLITLLPQAGIAQAVPVALMPASCNGTATAMDCARREPGFGKFDVSLTGPSGTRALFGVCPASRPQTIDLRPPATVESYDNRSQCQITLVDSYGMRHPVPFGRGVFRPGLVIVQVVIYPLDFPGRS
jgi:hypothetical protein